MPPQRPRAPGAPSDQALPRFARGSRWRWAAPPSQANRSARSSFGAVPTPSSGSGRAGDGVGAPRAGRSRADLLQREHRRGRGRSRRAAQRRPEQAPRSVASARPAGSEDARPHRHSACHRRRPHLARSDAADDGAWALFATTQQTAQAPKGVDAVLFDQRPKIPGSRRPARIECRAGRAARLCSTMKTLPSRRAASTTAPWCGASTPVQGGANQPPDPRVRADVEIPGSQAQDDDVDPPQQRSRRCQRKSHRRALPSPCRRISRAARSPTVPGILMKQSEQIARHAARRPRGESDRRLLPGSGPRNVETDRPARNIQLLKDLRLVRRADRLWQSAPRHPRHREGLCPASAPSPRLFAALGAVSHPTLRVIVGIAVRKDMPGTPMPAIHPSLGWLRAWGG